MHNSGGLNIGYNFSFPEMTLEHQSTCLRPQGAKAMWLPSLELPIVNPAIGELLRTHPMPSTIDELTLIRRTVYFAQLTNTLRLSKLKTTLVSPAAWA
jgi:hypothetical protein